MNLLPLDQHGVVTIPEGKTREYKRDLSSSERVLKTLVAFANSAGGELVIGINDDRTVAGVNDPFLEQERIAHLIQDGIRPQLLPSIEVTTIADLPVVIVSVAPGSQRPHYVASLGRQNGVFVRSGASTIQAAHGLIRELSENLASKGFDRKPVHGARMGDLDLDLIGNQLGRAVDESLLESMELVVRDQGVLIPTAAGLLVGSRHPEYRIPTAFVQCARFRGTERLDFADKHEIYGPITEAVDKVLEFLKKHAHLEAVINGVRRQDVWSIPVEPLRELLTNAMVHSSYDDPGTPIKVAFLDDRIEIESPGGLPAGQTVERMKSGVSIVRNKALARYFHRVGLMEQWGTGVRSVIAKLATEGLPEPTFTESAERLITTIMIPNHGVLVSPRAPSRGGVNPDDALRTNRDALSEPLDALSNALSGNQDALSHALSDRQAKMLESAKGEPVSRETLLSAGELSNTTRNAESNVQPLLDAGLIEWTIPEKPRSQHQRYQITDLGRVALARAVKES